MTLISKDSLLIAFSRYLDIYGLPSSALETFTYISVPRIDLESQLKKH